MKLKRKYIKRIISMCSIVALCFMMLSACSSDNVSKNDISIAMIKNSSMSTYGTGFAVGVYGKAVDTIITSYSIVATSNGAPPKKAEVRVNESEKGFLADVAFYDAIRNIAILKLPEPSKELKPLILCDNVNCNNVVYTRGYAGTGNIVSDFEKFNITDIIQYNGNISAADEIETIDVYKYSNEFNRGMVGAPALNDDGKVIGMCAYSLNSMNTYSQYILSSEEIERCLINQEIDFMTSGELRCRNIIILTVAIGVLVLLGVIAVVIVVNRKGKGKACVKKQLSVVDGFLKGKVYQFENEINIGRDPSKCEVVYPINEPGVSAVHCSIQIKEDGCYIVDNFSKYGTYLEDGTKISASEPYKIKGDKAVFYIAEPKNKFEFTYMKER